METLAVIFDMDGLMLDTERMARKAWTRALLESGFELDPNDYLRLLGRTIEDARGILGGLFGDRLPFDEVMRLRQHYYDVDIEENGIPLKPGLLDLLDFLERNAIPKAVASSTPHWFAMHKLTHTHIAARFLAIVGGDMAERGKPAPDLFLEAARRIDVTPERCVAFEDSDAGILAAHTAGMTAIMVPDLKPPAEEVRAKAYRVLPGLGDAIPLLEGFLQNGLPINGHRPGVPAR
jgi:HAD superfamily hydrolase (TIGR01509 family)